MAWDTALLQYEYQYLNVTTAEPFLRTTIVHHPVSMARVSPPRSRLSHHHLPIGTWPKRDTGFSWRSVWNVQE